MAEKDSLHPPDQSRRFPPWALGGLLLLAGLLYAGTFRTPWVYDDIEGIQQNPALRAGASLTKILNGSPPDSTPHGRPLIALSLAFNHSISGLDPWSYRLLNLGLHLGSALLLADLVRSVLRARSAHSDAKTQAIACWAAVLFTVHPLATTVVAYTVQRAEGQMSFFYLATLAAAARFLADPRRRGTACAAVLFCALGMASKETMVTAPLAVLVLHRACFAASWREVRQRWSWHLTLASTWAILAACMTRWPRSQSVGFGFEGVGAIDYLNLQTGAWFHYSSLLVAPWRMAIDHWPRPAPASEALAVGLAFAGLYVGSIAWAWRRSQAAGAGFIIAGLVLLPTSTVIPIFTSPVADHRMYLPAALGLAVLAGGICTATGRNPWRATLVLGVCASLLALATVRANDVYRSERAVWENATARDSNNPRALNNLGLALANEGQTDEGEAKIKNALRLSAGYADAWYNLGTLQGREGRLASAEESLQRAIALRPESAAAHCNLAVVLYERGRKSDAIRHYEEAIRLRPDYPAANFNLAVVWLETGNYAKALSLVKTCLRGDPDYPKARQLAQDLARLVQP